jgi:membrane-associated phospholipid phosphatase
MNKIRIRKPVVDYREFRLSRINEPEFSHIKLLSGWIVYLALYFVTENLIPVRNCHVIHCALDDMIPFNEWFLIFYCFWYVLLVLSLLYFFLYDIDSFRKLQIFIMITQAIAMIVYIIYPSVQIGRPEVMPRDNFLCDLASFIYAFDTPTGVCPSLHVAYSMGIASVWAKNRKATDPFKVFVIISTVLISISVVFVKQHSVLDIIAAVPVGMIAEYLIYGRTHAARRRLIRRKVRKLALKVQVPR